MRDFFHIYLCAFLQNFPIIFWGIFSIYFCFSRIFQKFSLKIFYANIFECPQKVSKILPNVSQIFFHCFLEILCTVIAQYFPKAGYTFIVSRISPCSCTISWTISWDCEPITIHFSQYCQFRSSLILRESWLMHEQ